MNDRTESYASREEIEAAGGKERESVWCLREGSAGVQNSLDRTLLCRRNKASSNELVIVTLQMAEFGRVL